MAVHFRDGHPFLPKGQTEAAPPGTFTGKPALCPRTPREKYAGKIFQGRILPPEKNPRFPDGAFLRQMNWFDQNVPKAGGFV